MSTRNEFWIRTIDQDGEVGTHTFPTEAERDCFRLGWETAGMVTLMVGEKGRIPTASEPCRRNSADIGLSVCECEYCEQQADMAQNDVPMARGPMLPKAETTDEAIARFARYSSPTS